MKYDPHKSSIGDLDANIIALLVYLIPMLLGFINSTFESLAFLIPLLAFFMEKKSEFVIFHAANSLAFFGITCILSLISSLLNLPLIMVTWIGNVLTFGLFSGFVAIIYVVLGIFFALVSILLFGCEIYSLIKGYQYEEVDLPVIRILTRFILSLHKS